MTRRADLALTLGFAIAIVAPAVGWWFEVDDLSGIGEHRRLAPAPSRGTPLAQWPRQAQAYVEDHFGFRRHLITAHHAFVWYVLAESPNPEVIRGRDGWMFFGVPPTVEVFRRALPPIPNGVLRLWRRVLAERRDWVARRGGVYRCLIVPEKQSIYPEKMPPRMSAVGAVHRMEQLVAYLERQPDTGFVNLAPALLAQKANGLTYYATDTHWTDLGTCTAYRALVTALADELPSLTPRPLASLLGAERSERGGDLARLCALGNRLRESTPALSPRPPFVAQREPEHTDESPRSLRWRSAAPQTSATAILFGDSFGDRIAVPLAEHFAALHYIATNDFLADRVEQLGATVVISQMSERLAVQWLPSNPVALRQPPAPSELEALRRGISGPRRFGDSEVLGARLLEVEGEPELTVAWRAQTATRLQGKVRITACDALGRALWSADCPQDPLASAVAAETTWTDCFPLMAGVTVVKFGLVDAKGDVVPCEDRSASTIECVLVR